MDCATSGSGKDGKENLLQPVGWTRPFRFDPVGVLVHTQHSGGLCQGAEFHSDRRWDDTERPFAMPAKIEISRSRIAAPLANAAAPSRGLRLVMRGYGRRL
jgi:hypothetical protein